MSRKINDEYMEQPFKIGTDRVTPSSSVVNEDEEVASKAAGSKPIRNMSPAHPALNGLLGGAPKSKSKAAKCIIYRQFGFIHRVCSGILFSLPLLVQGGAGPLLRTLPPRIARISVMAHMIEGDLSAFGL